MDYETTKVPHTFGPFDDRGIPLFDLRRVRLDGQPVYHPIIIIQYALAHYNMYEQGVSGADCIFNECVRWLESNVVRNLTTSFACWPYHFPLRTPRVTSPWISGMAQGQALSVLMRSYAQTGSAATADLARQAARCFLYTVSEGGVMSHLPSGSSFIEEVAVIPSIHILNGCLYGMIGLMEYLSLVEDPDIERVLDRCVKGVEQLLPKFDVGYWSRYSLGIRWHLATVHYHNVHIRQLNYLGEHLDNVTFLDRARVWEGYASSKGNQLRQYVTRSLQVNVNRVLTVLRIDSIKYKNDELD